MNDKPDNAVPDDLADLFARVTPLGPDADLRKRVLNAAGDALARTPRRRHRWERVFELAAAASLLIGVTLSIWQRYAEEQWRARVYGQSGTNIEHSGLKQALARATDPQTARQVVEPWPAGRRSAAVTTTMNARYEQLIREFSDEKASEAL